MKIAISQIAWDAPEDQRISQVLVELGVKYVESAPERLKTSHEIWQERGIQPIAMQALLFGQPAWNIFTEDQEHVLQHLEQVFRDASSHGVKSFVFGSPKNRFVSSDLQNAEVYTRAEQFFRQVGDVAAKYEVFLCLEPVPVQYGCNFLTTTAQTVNFLERVAHPHLKLNLDVGALQINNESPAEMISFAQDFIQHVHISEPNLEPIHAESTFHHQAREALEKIGYDNICSIEMKKIHEDSEKNADEIHQVLQSVQKVYAT